MPKHYDAVIIGGGVSGSSTAYFLAANPDFDGSILVIERDPTYEFAPSAKATGGFRQQFSTPENVEIGLFGVAFVKNAGEYLSVDGEAPELGFRAEGYLLLATEETLPIMRENNEVQRRHGADIVLQSPAEIAERFPWLNTEGLGGGSFGQRNEGWLDPYALVQAFRRKARSLGVAYLKDEAIGIAREGRRASAVELAAGGEVRAGIVVNAAGARDVASLCARVGIALPVEPRLRCTFVFDCREDLGVTPLTILPQGIGFRPEGRGFITNVAPEHDPVTHGFDIDYRLFEEVIWPALAERVPAFEAIKLVRAWSCHYDVNTLDENAIIGLTPELDNFYIAAGFSGHGLQQSPAVGRALCELISYGEFRTLDLARFGYERILTGDPILERNCF